MTSEQYVRKVSKDNSRITERSQNGSKITIRFHEELHILESRKTAGLFDSNEQMICTVFEK